MEMAELEYDGSIKSGGLAPLSALGAPAQRRGKETAVFFIIIDLITKICEVARIGLGCPNGNVLQCLLSDT